jgi:hypothetical protein
MLFASCCRLVGVPPLWRCRPNTPFGIVGASGCSPWLPTTLGGLDAAGMQGPPLFVASGALHGLCSGKAEAFGVPPLNPGAGSETPLHLSLMA